MFLNCDLKALKLYNNKPKSTYLLTSSKLLSNKGEMANNMKNANPNGASNNLASNSSNSSSNCNNMSSITDLVLHKSSSSIEKLDDNFCGAFQEHYEYLMDKGLIETCQHSGTQLIQNECENMSGNVSFKEFLHQYNQLKMWLDKLRSLNNDASTSSYSEKYTKQIFYEEILKRSPRRELLNEYACHLVKYHPHLKHDVLTKLHYLNRQWRSIEFSIMSKHYFNQDISKDLKEDLKNFEYWLKEIELRVENLSIDVRWDLGEIEKRLSEHIRLQNDIESHAKIINSVLKLSSKLKQIYIDFSKFYENGLFLQNRWHCLWIKSLEWQFRLEQEIARRKKANKASNIESSLQITNSNAKPLELLHHHHHRHHFYNQQQRLIDSSHRLLQIKTSSSKRINSDETPLDSSKTSSSTNSVNNDWSRTTTSEEAAAAATTATANDTVATATSDLNEENKANNDFHTDVDDEEYYDDDDDIIPFDASEYEKIVCCSSSASSTSSSVNLVAYYHHQHQYTTPNKTEQEVNYSSRSSSSLFVIIITASKSLNDLTRPTATNTSSSTFFRRRAMSTNDLFAYEQATNAAAAVAAASAAAHHQNSDIVSPDVDLHYQHINSDPDPNLSTKPPTCPTQPNTTNTSHTTQNKKCNSKNQSTQSTKKKINKSNSELTRRSTSSEKHHNHQTTSRSHITSKKDLTYYYSLTNVKYDDDGEEIDESETSSRRFSSSSLSSISSSTNHNKNNSTSHATTSSSDEEDIVLEEYPHENGEGFEEKVVPSPFYRLQKSITLPNANEIAQYANYPSMGDYIKSRSSSSLLDDRNRYDDDNEVLMNMNNNQVWVGDDDNVPYSSMSPSSASNKPNSDEQQQPATINPQLSVHHKSLSDYCVTSSRYILSRFRRRYRAYRQHFRYASANRCCGGKLSKSMSINRRGLYSRYGMSLSSCEGGDEADDSYDMEEMSSSTSSDRPLFYDHVNMSNSDGDIDDDLEHTNTYRSHHHRHVTLNQYENEPSGLTKVKNVVFHKYEQPAVEDDDPSWSSSISPNPKSSENDYLKVKLNKLLLLTDSSQQQITPPTTNTSAYDTCSQLSNDQSINNSSPNTNSSSSANNKKSSTTSSTTSGNTSGDYNQFSNNENYNETPAAVAASTTTTTTSKKMKTSGSGGNTNYHRSHNSNINTSRNRMSTRRPATSTTATKPPAITLDISNTIISNTSATTTAPALQLNNVDETTHTDVSDPHWDGYTSSPYYSNSVTVEDICQLEKAEKVEPILPWDEIFFELDPFEEVLAKENNVNESQSRVGLKSNSKSLHHHNQHASCCYHHGVGNGGAFAKQRGLNPLSANCLNNHHSHHHYYYHHYHHYYGEDDDKLKITDRFHKSSSLFHRVKPSTSSNSTKKPLQKSATINGGGSTSTSPNSTTSSSISSREEEEDTEEEKSRRKKKVEVNVETTTATTTAVKKTRYDEMEYVLTVVNDSLSQLDRVSRRCPHLVGLARLPTNKLTFKRPISMFVDDSASTSTSTAPNRHSASTLTSSAISSTTNPAQIVLSPQTDYTSLLITSNSSLGFVPPPKFNDILETCHANISSLASIKNSIVKHFKNNNKKKSSSKSHYFATADSDKIDYYIFKIDDTINKWKMLETAAKEDNEWSTALAKLEEELKPLRERIEYVSNLSKPESLPASSELDSCESLRRKIEKLEDESLALVTVLNKLNECKQEFNKMKESQEDLSKQVELLFLTVNNEISAVEDLQKTASVDLKIKIKKLESLLSTWSKLEELNERLKSRLHSDELEHIINSDHSLNYSKTGEFDSDLDEEEEAESTNEDILIVNRKNPSQKRKLAALNLSEADLDEIGLELEKAQTYLNSVRSQLVDLFRDKTSDLERQISPYNRLQLTMDNFKFQLNYLKTHLLSPQSQKQPRNEDERNTRLLIDLAANQISYKANSTSHQRQHKGEYSPDMLTNIHLDFQLNDDDEFDGHMKTSTPRYRNIEIENNKNRLLLSSTTKSAVASTASSSGTSAKPMFSVDDKSSQTESKSSPTQYRSLDSGITSGLDHTTDLGSYSSSTGPFNYSLNSARTTPIAASKTRQIKPNIVVSQRTDKQHVASKSLPMVNELTTTPKSHHRTTKMPTIKLESTSPTNEEQTELRHRLLKKEKLEIYEENNNSGEIEAKLISAVDEDEEKLEHIEELLSDEAKLLGREQFVAVDDDQEEIAEVVVEQRTPRFSFIRMLFYGLIFTLFFLAFAFLFLPHVIPSCCDYRKDYLIFNEQNYNNDEMLPF